jgi:hypothetical protein
VTLDAGALTENYLKVKLASARQANRIVDVKVGGVTADGLYESGVMNIMAHRA